VNQPPSSLSILFSRHTKRREFITLLGGASAAWPLTARAQQPALPVVGFLNSKTEAASLYQVLAFRQGLSEVGFVEGRNVAIEYRWAEGQLDRVPSLAADLARRRVAAMFTEAATTPSAMAATSTIPIVFVSGPDPVEAGFVTNLNRPGGNVTGVGMTTTPLNAKRLELLHELVPKPAVIAALMDTISVRQPEANLRAVEAAAHALGRQILIVKANTEREIDDGFATVIQAGARALFVGVGPLYVSKRRQLIALAARHALPASYQLREFVVDGGLMSYGASDMDGYRRGGLYVGHVLKGANPGDLPVDLPTKYELVLNLATAKALHLEIPPNLLALADEVIE
jgi:putative ABC transport system substrate-binding protein